MKGSKIVQILSMWFVRFCSLHAPVWNSLHVVVNGNCCIEMISQKKHTDQQSFLFFYVILMLRQYKQKFSRVPNFWSIHLISSQSLHSWKLENMGFVPFFEMIFKVHYFSRRYFFHFLKTQSTKKHLHSLRKLLCILLT